MKIKNSNVAKFKDVIIEDKKISALYIKLKSVLSKNNKNSTYAVAVSGGPDSMLLLYVLSKWANKKDKILYAFSFDHNLREESSKELVLVEKF